MKRFAPFLCLDLHPDQFPFLFQLRQSFVLNFRIQTLVALVKEKEKTIFLSQVFK